MGMLTIILAITVPCAFAAGILVGRVPAVDLRRRLDTANTALAATQQTIDTLIARPESPTDLATLMASHTERTIELMGDALVKAVYPTLPDGPEPAPEPDDDLDEPAEFYDPRFDPDGHADVTAWMTGPEPVYPADPADIEPPGEIL